MPLDGLRQSVATSIGSSASFNRADLWNTTRLWGRWSFFRLAMITPPDFWLSDRLCA